MLEASREYLHPPVTFNWPHRADFRDRIGDDELRLLFENYGLVQSCIVNQDKRHAFIKMLTREDAVKAKAGMETYRTEHMTLRVSAPKSFMVGVAI